MKPRPYQAEAVAALNQALRERDDNPCIVLPTGAGKSLVIAWTIQQWRIYVPHFRIIVLAHRSELIEQNAAELATIAPDAEYGIYAAGLDRRDTDQGVIYATIDSVYNKAIYFSAFDAIIVDEAHRIPAKGEGKYQHSSQTQSELIQLLGWWDSQPRLTDSVVALSVTRSTYSITLHMRHP